MLLRIIIVLKIKFNVKLVFKVQKQSFADVLQNRRSWKYHKFHRKTPVLESLLNKVASPQALLKKGSNTSVFLWNLWNFQEQAGGCFWKFKKCLCSTNFYPTTKQQRPHGNFEKKKMLLSSYSEKMRWEQGWQLKSCLHLIYFHSCFFATGVANVSPNIFIGNILLKTLKERNA